MASSAPCLRTLNSEPPQSNAVTSSNSAAPACSRSYSRNENAPQRPWRPVTVVSSPSPIRYRRPGSDTGSGRSMTPSMSVTTAVVPPMPSASVTTAAAVNARDARSLRQPWNRCRRRLSATREGPRIAVPLPRSFRQSVLVVGLVLPDLRQRPVGRGGSCPPFALAESVARLREPFERRFDAGPIRAGSLGLRPGRTQRPLDDRGLALPPPQIEPRRRLLDARVQVRPVRDVDGQGWWSPAL